MRAVNNSELKEFRDCAYRHGRRYTDGLEPDVEEAFGAKDWGTVYHAAQDVLWVTKSVVTAAEVVDDALTLPEHEEARQELKWALAFYAAQMDEQLKTWDVLGTEVRIAMPLGHGLLYYGTLDLLAWDPLHKRLVIVDHKTTGSDVAAFEGRISLDTQSAGYVWLVQEAQRRGFFKGFQNDPIAFQWHVVRRKKPSAPKVNKDGKVSVAAIDTLQSVYLAALEEQTYVRSIAPTDEQVALVAALRGKEHSWFRLTEHYVSDPEVTRWREEARATVRLLGQATRLPVLQLRNTESCLPVGSPRCRYKEVCLDPGNTYGFRRRAPDPEDLPPAKMGIRGLLLPR